MPTPPDPDRKPSPAPDSPEGDPHLSERLDSYYKSRKEAGDLQTTEIPISMLMAMDRLAKLGGDPSRLAQPAPTAAHNPEPIPGHPHAPVSGENGRDPEGVRELSGHLKRVAAFARLLALKTGMSEKEANFVKQISPMHDIGKWAIPEAILQKPGSLTPEEWEIMKTHTSVGYEMLKDSKLEVLRMGALVAVQHQEKYDGTGYPSGLKGDEIHVYSRITTVADVFDALGSERSYKQAWAVEDIIRYFEDGRGTHFDPVLVDLLLDNLQEFLAIRATFE
jgi:HD domain